MVIETRGQQPLQLQITFQGPNRFVKEKRMLIKEYIEVFLSKNRRTTFSFFVFISRINYHSINVRINS